MPSPSVLTRSVLTCFVATAVVAQHGRALAGAESSLHKCQQTVQKASAKFMAATASFNYWTSTTSASSASFAWVVVFGPGSVDVNSKTSDRFVRAVRGAS